MSSPAAAASAPGTFAADAASKRADVGSNIPSQVIFKREHDATESVPLTYREYVFLVAAGTSESGAETLIGTQFSLVLDSLANVSAGKLVNLAVFDVAFQGKPPVAPLATLMWKDWRGAAVIEFPRRPGFASQGRAQPPMGSARPVANAGAPLQKPPADSRPRSVPPVPTKPAAAPDGPGPSASAISLPTEELPIAVAPVRTAAVATPVLSPPSSRTLPTPPLEKAVAPAVVPQARARGEDLIADLFELMHDLHFLRDAVEGGDFCISLAMEKMPSQMAIVHLYDIDRREFVVTSARGVAAETLLLRRHTEGDAMLRAAMGRQRALVVADATQGEATSLNRYAALGGPRSLMIASVMQSGRFLGAIELVNPLDGHPYTEGDGNALTYIAEQFAEFVAARGIVTDPRRISPGASPG